MSGFSAQWLALREPYDRSARNASVLDAVAAAFADRTSVAVVDLACGAGASLRAISPRLPQPQSWRLVDNDLGLLARTVELARPPRLSVTAQAVDLARDLELALDGPLDLVTCSALLDLVSQPWLERLAVEAAARRLPVYAALSYDGEAMLEPAEPFDAEMVAALGKISDLAWRLTIAGDRERSRETAQLIDADIARLGLVERVRFVGAVPTQALMDLYAAADLFVLPSRFEGYGMAYAEAIAHGLPVVGTKAGAIPETIPAEAGLLVPADNVEALVAGLRGLIEDREQRARLAAGARATRFPSWREQAALFARALEAVG